MNLRIVALVLSLGSVLAGCGSSVVAGSGNFLGLLPPGGQPQYVKAAYVDAFASGSLALITPALSIATITNALMVAALNRPSTQVGNMK